ncbi:DUF308 domain-containing protein [Novosphingobium sp. 1949]|uniref:DUF308 domain-containing protein n=1 Tax=Novosphingobium organovorum TaxID=2930092 RepID=A0ABT0BAB6_9SPHN|nr:DUF308 domain-containing protein [Novosphingobium organovorum]MCJ2182002.1 DUF308 domain-containing protein [Novosphingobium organovorum]
MQRERIDPALTPDLANDRLVEAFERAPGKTWGWVLAYGLLLLLFALVVVTNPLVAGVATGLMVGLVLVLYGVAAVVAGATSLSQRARWLEVGLGVLALIAGVFALADPVAGALSLVWAMGVWLLVAGVIQLLWARRARHDRGWRLLLGVLDVVLGLILLVAPAGAGLAFLAAIVMVSFVVRGVFLVMLALDLRRMA